MTFPREVHDTGPRSRPKFISTCRRISGRNMPEAFCPQCSALLGRSSRGGERILRCRRCGYEARTARSAASASGSTRHPDFPFFPYDRIRGGQREFMEDIRQAVASGKVLLAQAPTGIGKTVATLSAMLEDALGGDRVVFFVTSKQSQHTIVIDTLRTVERFSGRRIRAVDIISRQSMCPDTASAQPAYAFREMCKARTKSRSCPYEQRPAGEAAGLIFKRIMHVHELQRACVRAGFCPHKAAQEAMGDANVVVCDYNYIFDGIAGPILAEAGKGLSGVLLVVDESHNLPDRIRSNLSLRRTSYELEQAMVEIGGKSARGARYTKALRRWLDGRASKLLPGAEEYVGKDALEDVLESAFSEVLGQKDDMDRYVSWLRETGEGVLKSGAERSFAMELGDFLDAWRSGGSGVARIFSKNEDGSWALRIAYLEAETAAGPVLAEVGAAVLMSGTLVPPGMYADMLGVPPERRVERIYESPFPRENRLVLGLGGLTTQYTRRDAAMYGRYAAAITALSLAVRGNVAAFFTSYRFLEEVASRMGAGIRGRDIVVESRSMGKRDRAGIVERLHDPKGGQLLLAVQGGGLSEGIDYEGNILSIIAVAGMPLAPPNLEVRALMGHFSARFGEGAGNLYGYIAPAMNKVVQSAGRLIRSEKDRGVIVLLDERFAGPRYSSFLPPEMRPGMIGDVEELVGKVRGFFRKG